jgi:diguanylate cyclase (GGDEF)-like protein
MLNVEWRSGETWSLSQHSTFNIRLPIGHSVADDLLFRWGGDEFLVVMPQSPLELVMQRFATLHDDITTPRGITCTVSWGAAAFPNADELDAAIREADRIMYSRKAAARAS